jgi:ferredoxin
MEVTVDRDLCEANAVCCGLAPDVFELDADEVLVIKVANPAPDQLAKVQKAVERCPRAALELRGD